MEALDFEKLKTDLHSSLLSRIDLEKLSSVDETRARRAVGSMIQEIVGAQKVPLNAAEKEQVGSDLLDEVFGLGPLEPLLKDPSISDILVNNRNVVYVERFGILERSSAKFRDDRHLMQVIERIVSIEDAAELQLKHEDVVRLETRPPNVEGLGAVRQRHLLINSLRMRPDRIIIGEVRGDEAFDMLQAMNTGHEGSMTTIHANTSRDALSRLESMVAMAGINLPDRAVRQQITSAISIIVQVSRMSDGSRKVINISEISGME